MKNDTRSSKLVMVNSSGQEITHQDSVDDSSVEYVDRSMPDNSQQSGSEQNLRTTLLVFMTVSIACTTAAIAAGSYALWLSRRQAARKVLTDVNDILITCQRRMQQLESDVMQLPGRSS